LRLNAQNANREGQADGLLVLDLHRVYVDRHSRQFALRSTCLQPVDELKVLFYDSNTQINEIVSYIHKRGYPAVSRDGPEMGEGNLGGTT
jgi:hypothetical protein